ncbi:MAG: DUF6563 family protein [Cyclobacteriaceae bacterium]
MKSVLTLLILIIAMSTFGQTTQYPKGVYMSFEEIISKSPSVTAELEIERRTSGDIKMNGGNDYKIHSIDKSISKKTIKKEIWAYSSGDTLFINGFQYKIQPWYTNLILDGRFLVFKAGLSQYGDKQQEQLQMGYYFGAIGGAIQGAKLAMLRFLYVVDKETGEIDTITPDKIKQLLGSSPELLTQFQDEDNQEDEGIWIEYMSKLNDSMK